MYRISRARDGFTANLKARNKRQVPLNCFESQSERGPAARSQSSRTSQNFQQFVQQMLQQLQPQVQLAVQQEALKQMPLVGMRVD